MTNFSGQLIKIRKKLGHKSAKSFYDSLKEHGELGLNYSYYIRVEKGDTLPSNKIVNTLCNFLHEEFTQALIYSYCQDLFPKRSYLFEHYMIKGLDDHQDQLKGDEIISKVNEELSMKQVDFLGINPTNYYMFMLLTLARESVTRVDLEEHFQKDDIAEALKGLKEHNFIVEDKEGNIKSSCIERVFPEAYNDQLKQMYVKFDKWDIEFGHKFDFDSILNKSFIRRISFRYLNLIKRQLEVVFDFVKSSDEVDLRYNDKVIHMNVSLSCGKIPG